MSNNVKQGRILSPILLNVYLYDNLYILMNASNIGGNINSKSIHYAADICLMNTSSIGMQHFQMPYLLYNVLQSYSFVSSLHILWHIIFIWIIGLFHM